MTMEIHGYAEGGSIEVTLEGVRAFVPDNLGNRHRQIIAEWQANGNTVPPCVPPTPRPVGEIDQAALNAALAAEGRGSSPGAGAAARA